VTAYTVVDISAILGSESGQPFAAFVNQVLPQKIALAILSLTIIAGFCMGQGCMVAASRVTFAYARDGVFPFSKFIATVNKRTRTPVNAVIVNCTTGCILLLLIFGGSLAAGALFSIGAIAAFVSFTIPIFIRVLVAPERFHPGPWHLGKFSMPIGIVGLVFVALMVPIMCLPAVTGADLTVQTMNWTICVYGGPMTAIMIWWAVSARKWFKGPKVNVEHVRVSDMVAIEGVVGGKGDALGLKKRKSANVGLEDDSGISRTSSSIAARREKELK